MSETTVNRNNCLLHKCLMAICSLCAWSSFGLFIILCVVADLLRSPFIRDPQERRRWFVDELHKKAYIPLYVLRGVHVRVENPANEMFRKQAVIICNHQSALDLMAVISTVPRMSILLKKDFGKLWLFRALAKRAGYHFVSDDYAQLFRDLEADMKSGYHLLVFPEGTRTRDGGIGTFQTGAFTIARYFGLDILPLHIKGMYEVLPKGRFRAESHDVCLRVLPRISTNQPLFRSGARVVTKRLEAMYRKLHEDRQHVCVIGGGMGGLFTGAILAEAGYRVTVLEKNSIIGGGLQSFRRGNAVFNTGMHNFGGFAEEWALSHLLHYLHIKNELRVMPVDEDAQEILFTAPDRCYRLPKGRDAFERYLSGLFPDQADGLHRYLDALHAIAYSFDHYVLRPSQPHPEVKEYAEMTVEQLLRLYITDEELIRVLGYVTPMCGHTVKDIPVSVYSMLAVLYLSGEYRFKDNAMQLADALVSSIQSNGGMVLSDCEVNKMDVKDIHACSVTAVDGRVFTADWFVAAVPPKTLFSMTDAPVMRKVARNRAAAFTTEISAMSLFIELNEDAFPFINSTVLLPAIEHDGKMPDYILMTTPPVENQGQWAHTVEILSPVYYDDFLPWEDTRLMQRGEDYELYKQHLAEDVIAHIARYYPSLPSAVRHLTIASPLTIRDYYNNPGGALFAQQGLYMPIRTRTDNLFFTGQSVLFHGLCGVPLTAILTAETLSGKDLVTDIRNATKD